MLKFYKLSKSTKIDICLQLAQVAILIKYRYLNKYKENKHKETKLFISYC